ncbi:class I SAM-dependent methyltransferase [Mycobacteroides salmoniphilum]|uniref:class I SAM-dependent methyltransferase n=1 Tax=Mycobacteroides salmoniphilum TaxID=404941 RepID=UPI0010658725|nr:class I SAM-dependent methyltransferase [Mycobacteroides salmoniphilum]
MATDDAEAPVKDAYLKNADYWIRIVRERLDPYQQQITDPALLAAIGDPSGLECLDAGCGEGHFARQLVERGARHIYGVDNSQPFVAAAVAHEAADQRTSTFYHSDVARLPLADGCVDLVYANRLPHALACPERRFHEFARVLRSNGRLIQLSLHPCFYVARSERDQSSRQSINARDYFAGRTITQHFDVDGVSPAASVQRFYSLEEHVRLITEAGFVITDIAEPRPHDLLQEGTFWADTFRFPMFLLITARLER